MTRGVRKHRKWIREIGRHGIHIEYEVRQWKGETLRSAKLVSPFGAAPFRPKREAQSLWRKLRTGEPLNLANEG
jgi:hypothetical protein